MNISLKILGMCIGLYQLFWITGQATVGQYFEYNLAGSYLYVLVLLVGFGVYAVLQKEWTNSKDADYHSRLWTTMFVARLILVALGLLIAFLIPQFETRLSIQLVALLFLQSAIILIDYNYFAVYSARGEVWKFSVTDLIGKCVALLLLFIYFAGFRFGDNPVIHFVVAQLISVIFAFLLDVLWNLKTVRFGRFDFSLLRKLLPSMLLLAFSWLLMGLYAQTQPIVLDFFGTDERLVNGFVQAFTLVNQAILAVSVLNTQLASSVKDYANTTQDAQLRIQNFTRSSMIYMAVLLLGYVALVVIGPYILNILDNQQKYTDISISLLPILGIFFLFSSFSGMLSYINLFYHQEKVQVVTIAVQLVLSIAGFMVLVPSYGVWGIAYVVAIVSVIDVCILRLPLTIKLLNTETPLIDKR